ncbi:MAG TPA: quinolinate synthase NadA [Deltaproteobacteria bacterium]|nr:quinolinate synthase NadA [Deltaproteobacteria bacterium]
MKSNEAESIITKVKKEMGSRMVILGHHYQSDDVLKFADFIGDSLELARKASVIEDAEVLVFCGVYFMAETAFILAQGKSVYIPDVDAGCPLADMARIEDVTHAWERICSVSDSVVPMTYVNSSASIKAFCGENDGIVCTSGNAYEAFAWSLSVKDKVFFMPDRNLGRNTAYKMNIADDLIIQWDPGKPDGGLVDDEIARARVILWKGWCPVHWPDFSRESVENIRRDHPGIKIIVHPESDPDTVKASDASGSTAQIIEYLKGMKIGDSVAIGTEFNMVSRLSDNYHSILMVLPLRKQLCSDMAKITLEKLALTLSSLDQDTYRVKVDDKIAQDALKALQNMLRIRT